MGAQGRIRAPSCGVSCSAEGVGCLLARLFPRAQMPPKFQIQKKGLGVDFETCMFHQKLNCMLSEDPTLGNNSPLRSLKAKRYETPFCPHTYQPREQAPCVT